MKTIKRRIPVIVACAAAVLLLVLLVFGGIGRSLAQPLEPGDDAANEIELGMAGLEVGLYENGKPADTLLADLNSASIDPGKNYEEKISAYNGSDDPEYVRMIVRRYWKDKNDKRIDLDPALIRLSFGDAAYNSEAWTINEKEHTSEQDVYYLKKALAADKESALLFDQIAIDASVSDLAELKTSKDGLTITAEYAYDSLTFVLEAEVQSVQFEYGKEAAASAWGVPNVTIENETVTIGKE